MTSDKECEGLDRYLLKRYDVIRLVGKGAYGIVWRVVEKETGRTMALKKCFDAFQNSTDAQRTFREIIFLQELNGHENIVRLMNVLKAERHQDIYVLFDCMESDLQQVITASVLQPIHMEYVTYQVLKALKYIHSGGVLHRDLKPANVLLNANCHVRICDFGLARTAASMRPGDVAASVVFTDYVATRWYRAPELLVGCTMYGEGVDMWSVGCIIGEMLGGKPVLKGRSTMDQLEKILQLTGKPSESDMRPIMQTSTYAKTMLESLGNVRQMPSTGILFLLKGSETAKDLALRCMSFNPEKRPSAEDALGDPYVEKFHLQEAEPLCDKIIRMPIADTTKMKARDYQNQIYAIISQRRQQAKEDSLMNNRHNKRDPRLSGRAAKNPSSASARSSSRDEMDEKSVCMASPPQGWNHEGGATAPPCTPR